MKREFIFFFGKSKNKKLIPLLQFSETFTLTKKPNFLLFVFGLLFWKFLFLLKIIEIFFFIVCTLPKD